MTGATELHPLLAELDRRLIADQRDKETWLNARRDKITATDVRDAYNKSVPEWLKGKLAPRKDLSRNHVVKRGNDYEPILLDRVEEALGVSIVRHGMYAAIGHPRLIASPDGVFVRANALLATVEAKTSVHELDPKGQDTHFWTLGYYEQCQWQMYVTGASICVFVWSRFASTTDDTEIDWGWDWIERDDKRIGELIELSAQMLAALDRPEGFDWGADMLGSQYRDALDAEGKATEVKKRAYADLLDYLSGREFFEQGADEGGTVKIVYRETKKPQMVTVVDEKSAIEQHPDVVTRVNAARSELEKAEAEWAAILADYTATTPAPPKTDVFVWVKSITKEG